MARQRLYTRPAIAATVALCVAVVLLRAATGTRATPWSHSTAADSGTQFASLHQRSLSLSSATDGISDGSTVPAVVGTGSSLAALVYSNVSSTSLCIGVAVACTNHCPAHVGFFCFTVLTPGCRGVWLGDWCRGYIHCLWILCGQECPNCWPSRLRWLGLNLLNVAVRAVSGLANGMCVVWFKCNCKSKHHHMVLTLTGGTGSTLLWELV